MKIAAFLSHPIQHFSPLWVELARLPGVELKVFYYARQGTGASYDPDFETTFEWDVDLLAGHDSEFLPRRWPARDEFDYGWKAANRGLKEALTDRDVAYVAGYAHVNNWLVARHCRRLGIPLLFQGDANFLTAQTRRSRLRLAFKRLLVPRILDEVTVFLAVGDHNRDYLTHYGAAGGRIRYCAIPVDTRRFREAAGGMTEDDRVALRKRYDIAVDQFVIGFCGKLRDIKRPGDLCEALNRLDRREMVGLFVGSGQMEEQVRQLGGDRVRITGFVNQRDVPRLLSICDITVMPSEMDNHPLSVTESQCLGVPVVLSDMCGCYGPNDVFRDGESGLLYRCGDVEQLAEKIAYLADHPQVLARMGRRAIELAETQSAVQTAIHFRDAALFAIRCGEGSSELQRPGSR